MNKDKRLGIIMDPIAGIDITKDSSFAMLLAAQARGWSLHYMEASDLYMDNALPMAAMRPLTVQDDLRSWFAIADSSRQCLSTLDIILMRKDPPFNLDYIYLTYLLEHAAQQGVLVVNHPTALRQVNEKFFITHFKECIAPTQISCDMALLAEFIAQYERVIIKPLDSMGGNNIYQVSQSDPNCRVILEQMTGHGRHFVMAQQFIDAIKDGDKRILLIDGEPVPYALARVPLSAERRGNLVRGAKGHGVPLTERDRWLCAQVGPRCRDLGLLFVGLDVIGDYLTEINVTSPTCIRELDKLYQLNIAEQLMVVLEKYRRPA